MVDDGVRAFEQLVERFEQGLGLLGADDLALGTDRFAIGVGAGHVIERLTGGGVVDLDAADPVVATRLGFAGEDAQRSFVAVLVMDDRFDDDEVALFGGVALGDVHGVLFD